MNRLRQMFYDSPAWRRVRLVVLARDGGLCQIRDRDCDLDAGEVDHIIRPEDGGAWYDEANLRAACRRCNAARGGRVGAARTNARLGPPPSREW